MRRQDRCTRHLPIAATDVVGAGRHIEVAPPPPRASIAARRLSTDTRLRTQTTRDSVSPKAPPSGDSEAHLSSTLVGLATAGWCCRLMKPATPAAAPLRHHNSHTARQGQTTRAQPGAHALALTHQAIARARRWWAILCSYAGWGGRGTSRASRVCRSL